MTYRRGQQAIKALDEVSFEVRQGEFARLVGPSGSAAAGHRQEAWVNRRPETEIRAGLTFAFKAH